MRKITVPVAAIIVFSFTQAGFCERPFDVTIENAVRIDIQEEQDNIYLGRIGITFQDASGILHTAAI